MNTTQLVNIFPQTISLNQVISLVTEVEAEVYTSPTYCNAVATLTKHPTLEKKTASILKKLTRSVIRLAFHKFIASSQFSQQTLDLSSHPAIDDVPNASTENSHNYPIPKTAKPRENPLPKTEDRSETTATAASKGSPPKTYHNFANKVKDFGTRIARSIESLNSSIASGIAQQSDNSTNQLDPLDTQNNDRAEKERRLKEIGFKIRDARLAKSIGITQLHLKTAILASQIEAIENGLIEKLPEDIYLQGYIHRLGNAVGLNGDLLAKYFINPHPNSWPDRDISATEKTEKTNNENRLKNYAKYHLTSTHLFFGYMALVSGAIGMLSSAIDPANSQIHIPEVECDRNEPPACSDRDNFAPHQTPELNSLDNSITAKLSISPPELLSS